MKKDYITPKLSLRCAVQHEHIMMEVSSPGDLGWEDVENED